ncbi:T9SS type A sorting domain-containing protein [Chryseobacterium fistulae]|uniref:Fibronectin type-III domain-containing protein n=1 Tax=Chryseobacterium fistulae TaxID=2675058 RepID=A0A6N4XS84_9FLAO|nr:T9SS type A sorting domain-containing protein [Chryseobacterium fistulae]CAA7386612.1 hypothetical protein CHRY9393_00909 [Chryseobacterium fistulae]
MQRPLLLITGLIFSKLCLTSVHAQEYQPLLIQSGLNADVIANGIGSSSDTTNNDIDGVSYAFVSQDFQLTPTSTPITYGLPVDGIINSSVASTNGLSYQMAPYSSNNSLRLHNPDDSGTITFATPTPAMHLYMLATGGSGECTVNVTINFTDATSQTFYDISIADWYNGSNYAIQGIGRINVTNNNLESGNEYNPRIYQVHLPIDLSNQPKNIQSVTITKTSTDGVSNIFAFSADVYNSCAVPNDITYDSTPTSVTLHWNPTAIDPSSGYEYYYSTSSTPPSANTVPTGFVTAGNTSVLIDNLITGQVYYFWIRSNCSTNNGFWKMKQFIPGQISSIYTSGDINTMFNNFPDPHSSTNCPGTLTMNIPSGYKIKSTDVTYSMTAQGEGWISDQESLLICTTNNNRELSLASALGSGGTNTYERTGLNIANGLTGNVTFELRAWRTFGGSDCSSSYNKINNNSWKVTLTLEPITLSLSEIKQVKEKLLYPNPFTHFLTIENSEKVKELSIIDLSGSIIKRIQNPSSTLNLAWLKSGIYVIKFIMTDDTIKTKKVIKK